MPRYHTGLAGEATENILYSNLTLKIFNILKLKIFVNRGRMEIGLQQNGCVYLKVVVHELLHSLGFMHEMNRPDRDSYVSMVWSNIQAAGASQFFRDAWDSTDDSNLPAECPYSGQPDGIRKMTLIRKY